MVDIRHIQPVSSFGLSEIDADLVDDANRTPSKQSTQIQLQTSDQSAQSRDNEEELHSFRNMSADHMQIQTDSNHDISKVYEEMLEN